MARELVAQDERCIPEGCGVEEGGHGSVKRAKGAPRRPAEAQEMTLVETISLWDLVKGRRERLAKAKEKRTSRIRPWQVSDFDD